MLRTVPTHSAYERTVYRHLRRERRKAAQGGDELKVAKIDFTLRNPEAFDLLVEEVLNQSAVPTEDLEVVFFGDNEYGVIEGLIMLLSWLVANWDTIANIIEFIANLFAEQGDAAAQALAANKKQA